MFHEQKLQGQNENMICSSDFLRSPFMGWRNKSWNGKGTPQKASPGPPEKNIRFSTVWLPSLLGSRGRTYGPVSTSCLDLVVSCGILVRKNATANSLHPDLFLCPSLIQQACFIIGEGNLFPAPKRRTNIAHYIGLSQLWFQIVILHLSFKLIKSEAAWNLQLVASTVGSLITGVTGGEGIFDHACVKKILSYDWPCIIMGAGRKFCWLTRDFVVCRAAQDYTLLNIPHHPAGTFSACAISTCRKCGTLTLYTCTLAFWKAGR